MKLMLKDAIAAVILALSFATPAAAGPFEDARAASEKGDYATALQLLRPLADQGNAHAQDDLGRIYFYAQGVPQNFPAALAWYRKAADQGYARAQYNLAFMHSEGRGAPQDFSTALTWYRKAADQGLADAQYALGNMYFNGQGVPQDFTAALVWYRTAADQGYARAQYNLAFMYKEGRGVPQDYVQAYILFNLAAARASDAETHDAAVKNRDYIAAKMTPVQIAEAQKAFADTLILECSFVGLIPEDVTYNVNRDTKEVEVIGKFGTHKGMLLSNTEGFFYVLEPNLGASVATIIYSKPGETPVGIRSMLGILNEDQFKGVPDDVKLSSERLRFMATSWKGRCREQASQVTQAPSQSEPKIAETGAWGPWPSDLTTVAAGFRHDDGGALIIQCDKTKRFMSYILEEPRAHWREGAPISVTTKDDDGKTTGPSAGVVIGPTRLVVGEQSTWDVVTMGGAKTFFAIGDGVYARVFPTANFRNALEPVLRACGDHW